MGFIRVSSHAVRSKERASHISRSDERHFLCHAGPFCCHLSRRHPDFSEDETAHRQHVRTVLQRLREDHFYGKLEKCEFHAAHVEFLGFLISKYGIAVTEEKISAIQNWPQPTNRKQVQGFLGLANYLWEFIPKYAAIAKPLTDLTSSKIPYKWSVEAEQGFTRLKDALTTPPVLRQADPALPFVVEPDASNFTISLGILQEYQGKWHPIAYRSRKLLSAEINYSIHDKELLAGMDALRAWRHHLMGA